MALIDKLTAIGDAIRVKTGGTEPLTLEAMAVTIRNLDFSKTTPINVVPSTNGSFTYDGTEKIPVWQNFDSEQLTISGTTSATNAGTYTVYFTPKAGYTWADESVESKTVQWRIAKAAGLVSLSEQSGKIYDKKNTKTFTVTRAGDGKISVKSSNAGIATVSLSGTTVTFTSVAYGSATITVSVAEGTNHTAPGNATYDLTVAYLYLIENGTMLKNFSITSGGNNPTISQKSGYVALQGDKVGYGSAYTECNLTDKTTLQITGTFKLATGGHLRFMVWNQKPGNDDSAFSNVVSYANLTTTGASIDVSGISGNVYVGVLFAYTYEQKITNLWAQ